MDARGLLILLDITIFWEDIFLQDTWKSDVVSNAIFHIKKRWLNLRLRKRFFRLNTSFADFFFESFVLVKLCQEFHRLNDQSLFSCAILLFAIPLLRTKTHVGLYGIVRYRLSTATKLLPVELSRHIVWWLDGLCLCVGIGRSVDLLTQTVSQIHLNEDMWCMWCRWSYMYAGNFVLS